MDLNEAGPALDRALRRAGLDPDRLNPWEAWRVFKEFARESVACDGEAIYVHLGMRDPTDELVHLTFVRQLAFANADGELEAVREIVCDLGFDPTPGLPYAGIELSDADFEEFDAFVAAVEAHPDFQAAIAREPAGSLVTWSEL
jgi:hypothetical protein